MGTNERLKVEGGWWREEEEQNIEYWTLNSKRRRQDQKRLSSTFHCEYLPLLALDFLQPYQNQLCQIPFCDHEELPL
jgi:hypothetical protein